MTQISRPFVIALAAVVLFAGVWFVALKPHSSGSESETTSSAPAPAAGHAPPAAAQQKSEAAPSHVDHTSVPGLEGLTRDINKAHGAVAQAQQSGHQTEEKAAHASGSPSSEHPHEGPAASATHTGSASAAAPVSKSTTTTPAAPAQTSEPATKSGSANSAIPTGQANVERILKENRVALVLFWKPHSIDDEATHLAVRVVATVHSFFEPFAENPETEKELRSRGISLQERIGVLESPASQVASYGTFTHTIPVYQTPTILIINPRGQVSEITGLTDAFVIEQRIGEAREVS